jgi:enoyl-CoA hydratase/carnithine racemase
LLYTGRTLGGDEGAAWGFFNVICEPERLLDAATTLACGLANGPAAAHALTKKMLHAEWAMPLDEAIDAEAQAQALCMRGNDFRRAYEAFAAKRAPVFEGD